MQLLILILVRLRWGVSKKVIDKYSVYSFECADEMSFIICKEAESDYGVGVTGKLNRVDVNNPYGEDNVVFISIYDKNNNKYYHSKIEATLGSRSDNKNLVLDKVFEMMMKIL